MTKLKVHGTPTEIQLNEEFGGRLRIFASSYDAEVPTGVTMQFDVEARDFTAGLTAKTPAHLDRIITALLKARYQTWKV